jgi:hypothetical protein
VVHEPEGEDFAASDAYIGPIDGEVDVILWNDLQGNTPNTWFRDSQAWLADEFGTEPTVTTELLTLADGASVRVFELHYTYEGDDYFFQQAVVFAGDRAWDVNWYSTPGTEDAARAMLLSFVGTFEPIAD